MRVTLCRAHSHAGTQTDIIPFHSVDAFDARPDPIRFSPDRVRSENECGKFISCLRLHLQQKYNKINIWRVRITSPITYTPTIYSEEGKTLTFLFEACRCRVSCSQERCMLHCIHPIPADVAELLLLLPLPPLPRATTIQLNFSVSYFLRAGRRCRRRRWCDVFVSMKNFFTSTWYGVHNSIELF